MVVVEVLLGGACEWASCSARPRPFIPADAWRSASQASAVKVAQTRLTTQAYIPGPYEEVLKRQADGFGPAAAPADTATAAAK